MLHILNYSLLVNREKRMWLLKNKGKNRTVGQKDTILGFSDTESLVMKVINLWKNLTEYRKSHRQKSPTAKLCLNLLPESYL